MGQATKNSSVPLWYSDLETLRREHPELDLMSDITIENFQALVAKTYMREELICQLRHDVQGRCNQPHHDGWLARSKDGKKGFIGGVCADKKFKASELYRAERYRLTKEIAIANHRAALGELLRDRVAVRARIAEVRHQLELIRREQRVFQDYLPANVQTQLFNMAKTGNRRVEAEVEYVERDENGKEKRTWRPRDIGAVQGLHIWTTTIANFYDRLDAAEAAVAHAVLTEEQSETQLKKWRESLEQLPSCEQEIGTYSKALAEFAKPENLSLLCFLVRNDNKQREIVALILRQNGQLSPREFEIQSLLNQIRKRIRDQNDGRNVRVMYG